MRRFVAGFALGMTASVGLGAAALSYGHSLAIATVCAAFSILMALVLVFIMHIDTMVRKELLLIISQFEKFNDGRCESLDHQMKTTRDFIQNGGSITVALDLVTELNDVMDDCND